MLSDDSSSDSETGRFKCKTKNQDGNSSSRKQDNFKDINRSRHSYNDRFPRDLDRKRDDRDRFNRTSTDQYRYPRHSPVRRRHSRERSPSRRSHERHRFSRNSSDQQKPRTSKDSPKSINSKDTSKPRDSTVVSKPRDSTEVSKPRDQRSDSKDKGKHSRVRSNRPPEFKRDLKEEIRRNITPQEKVADNIDKKPKENSLSSPEYKGKKSEVHRFQHVEAEQRKNESPIIIVEHDSDVSEEVQPGSYYNMIPSVVKEKSDESSEIDSSDDERLRAKLLNLEKELRKTKKKKHKRKHKRKSSKSKEKDHDTSVEVSSTTDIQDKVKIDLLKDSEIVEVSSTQKNNQKESSEEGEISSDDASQNDLLNNIDPTDLRHKLRQSKHDSSQDMSKLNADVCGPALPPHLKKQYTSPDIEGPVLPPHLKKKSNIGPSIPDDMRKELAENDRHIVKYVSSDEDTGMGPLPAGVEIQLSEAHQRLEERALEMKIKTLDGHSLHDSKVKSREEWMLELPEAKAKYLGLEARSFRAKEGPDMSDRSKWTDTPEDKERKAAGHIKEEDADVILKREARARLIANRDDEQEAAIKKHKKKHKREESLLDMHQNKLKKKKKKEDKEDDRRERRPFSRDVDLQVNRFDEAQKKSIIKKAQNLDMRFSRGEAKYL